MKIVRVGIIGTGAVGGMIFSLLHKKYKKNVLVIGNEDRTQRASKGLVVNGETLYPSVLNSDKEKQALDLMIVCVKNYHLKDALTDMASAIDKHTIILPLLNGVTATDVIQKAFPNNRVFYGIVMRTDAARVDYNVTYHICGEIQLGYARNEECSEDVVAVKDYLLEAGLNAVIYPDMLRMLWRKWMINIGANQISTLTEAKFKYFGMFEEIVILLRASMNEIVDIAKVKNIHLTEQDLEDVVQILINYPPEKKTSMLQDMEARRMTEIDSFAGTVMQYGLECNVPTPINTMLYYGIKAREKVYLMEKEEELRRANLQ